MSNKNSLFNSHVLNASKNLVETSRAGGDNPAAIRIIQSLLVIFLILGGEGMRIIYRNNFGGKGINLTMIIISAFCFGFFSYLAFTEHHFYFDIDDSTSTSVSFVITGAIFALLAFLIFVKGIVLYSKAKKGKPNSDYAGDSYLSSVCGGLKWNQSVIQNIVEPLYTIIIGILFYLYNPVGGAVIMFCGISLWFAALFDNKLGNSSINSMRNEMKTTRTQETITNQVHAD